MNVHWQQTEKMILVEKSEEVKHMMYVVEKCCVNVFMWLLV